MKAKKNGRFMDAFIADLAKFCRAKHGRVSELAEYLGIAQPHVSAWLAGKQEPSGEHTLRIQAWLQAESAKPVPRRPRVRTSAATVTDAKEDTPIWLL